MVNPAAIDQGRPDPHQHPAAAAQHRSHAQTRQGYNLITDLVTSDPRNQENLKLDYNISERMHLSGRFNHENENVPAPYGPYNTINYNTIPYPADAGGPQFLELDQLQPDQHDSRRHLPTSSSSPTPAFSLRISLDNLAAVSRSATSYPYANVYPGSDILPNISFSYNHAELADPRRRSATLLLRPEHHHDHRRPHQEAGHST